MSVSSNGISVAADRRERTAAAAAWWRLPGYLPAAGGVALATAVFHLARGWLDKGQASLLYLPVVIAVAVRFGFGPAVVGGVLSFLCWNFFFLPPFHTLTVRDPKDWLSLAVFLVAAVTTAQLAAQARSQAQQARAREAEIATLFQASEEVSLELRGAEVLKALTTQLSTLCHASRCLIYRPSAAEGARFVGEAPVLAGLCEAERREIESFATAAAAHGSVVGLGPGGHLWTKAAMQTLRGDRDAGAVGIGAYVPLRSAEGIVGVLHVGPRDDGSPYTAVEERVILTLANHAAIVIARDALAEDAAEAEALRKADQFKDSLLSLVSHELKTPLAAIKASVTALLQPGGVWEDGRQTETLGAIDRETDRLSALVSNLLDLSRIESGSWQPQRDWCDAADIAATAIDRMRPADAARVSLEVAPDLPLICVDHVQMSVVLANLLDNAAKYGVGGGPIELAIGPEYNAQDEAPTGVLFSVRDHGAGIAPGEERLIFDRFVRGTQRGGPRAPGTGLGLALAKALVGAHHGRICAENAVDGGAVFVVAVPIEGRC